MPQLHKRAVCLVNNAGLLCYSAQPSFDTIIEDMPENSFPDRPWDKGNNAKTAVWEFLKTNDKFKIDKSIENKLLITVAPDGYLKRVK